MSTTLVYTWRHRTTRACEEWELPGRGVTVRKHDALDWEVVFRGEPARRASTAWLALRIVQQRLGDFIPPFCDECELSRGWGV